MCPTTDAQTTETSVEVTASETTPGTVDSAATDTTPSTSHPRKLKHTPAPPPPPPREHSRIIVTTDSPITNLVCTTAANCGTTPPVQTQTTTPGQQPVTIGDIASFHPVTGATVMEPNGWAVIGLEANPYSSAVVHIVAGRLLGQPAEVRFTPSSWRWDYGDGAQRDTITPGASWKALGAAEFARTATSHSYSAAGTFTVRPGIRFTAAYRFDGGDWTPINGTVTVAGSPIAVVVGTASTVLVGADCSSDPTAPGC